MLTQSAIQSFFHADYSGTNQLLKQILEPIFGECNLGYDEITRSQTIKEKAKAAHIKTIKHVATFWAEGLDIKVFDVTLDDNCHIHIARKNIQLLVREYVEKFEGAFIVFHYENTANRSWRLSYLEKRQNTAASTNAKRYTYLCGKDYPCRTIAERFYALQSQDLNAINLEKAFSVEALSDEFFTEYTAQYNNICNYIYDNREDATRFGEEFADCEDKFIRDYVKKMMGRITFLHFLQKKGWMGVPLKSEWGQGDVNFMRHLFEYATPEQQENFLDEILEPLFFDCLNSPRNNDEFDTHITKIGKVRIPYLNGGLFEKDDIDKPQSTLPSQLFKDLLDFYARFNFTIDENDPLDAEVGVDPEMLGKIFENLLEDNKDKGAFYTPKEIVNYMCKESLIAYLVSEAQQASEVNKQRQENFDAAIRALVEDPEMKVKQIKRYDEKQLEVLSRALMEVKICDPAIGSGAFPMGLLNLLFKCRTAVNNALGQNVPPAELKKDIIRNNIYGVDIEKGAIDIARLRFWLSIVVDLEEPEALPNFDYKFMQGNSLLEQFAGVDLSDMFATKATEGKGSGVQLISFDEVSTTQTILHERLRHYFGMRTGEDKHQLREKVNQAVADLICAKVNEAPELVSQIRDIDVSANDKFFLWHTWFADVFNRPSKQGFDIVIGNPPYIDSETMTRVMPKERKIYADLYACAKGNWDIYITFMELSMKLGEVVALITPDKWLSKPFGLEFRKRYMVSRLNIITHAGASIFKNATVDAIVSLFVKSSNVIKGCKFIKENEVKTLTYANIKSIQDPYYIDFVFSTQSSLITKLDSFPLKLKDLEVICEGACATSDAYKAVPLLKESTTPVINKSTTYKLVNTGTIVKYATLWGKKQITYLGNKPLFPVINKDEFEKTLGRTYIQRAQRPKIIFKGLNLLDAFIDISAEFIPGKTTLVICSEDTDKLKFLCAIINSKLIFKYIKIKYQSSSYCGGITFTSDMINLLPLPANEILREKIISVVNLILVAKQSNPQADTNALEKEIDDLVYQLYELTPEEVAMIEQAN